MTGFEKEGAVLDAQTGIICCHFLSEFGVTPQQMTEALRCWHPMSGMSVWDTCIAELPCLTSMLSTMKAKNIVSHRIIQRVEKRITTIADGHPNVNLALFFNEYREKPLFIVDSYIAEYLITRKTLNFAMAVSLWLESKTREFFCTEVPPALHAPYTVLTEFLAELDGNKSWLKNTKKQVAGYQKFMDKPNEEFDSNIPIIKNWYLTMDPDTCRLSGDAYNRRNWIDGAEIHTTTLMFAKNLDDNRILVCTRNTVYGICRSWLPITLPKACREEQLKRIDAVIANTDIEIMDAFIEAKVDAETKVRERANAIPKNTLYLDLSDSANYYFNAGFFKDNSGKLHTVSRHVHVGTFQDSVILEPSDVRYFPHQLNSLAFYSTISAMLANQTDYDYQKTTQKTLGFIHNSGSSELRIQFTWGDVIALAPDETIEVNKDIIAKREKSSLLSTQDMYPPILLKTAVQKDGSVVFEQADITDAIPVAMDESVIINHPVAGKTPEPSLDDMAVEKSGETTSSTEGIITPAADVSTTKNTAKPKAKSKSKEGNKSRKTTKTASKSAKSNSKPSDNDK